MNKKMHRTGWSCTGLDKGKREKKLHRSEVERSTQQLRQKEGRMNGRGTGEGTKRGKEKKNEERRRKGGKKEERKKFHIAAVDGAM